MIDRSPPHHHETHGRRNDIDENTSLDEVRAPNVFERVKEEIEALVETIHPKKEPEMYERKFFLMQLLCNYKHVVGIYIDI